MTHEASHRSAETVAPFVTLALQCVHREFPHHLVHVVSSDNDLARPRAMNPAFYGCFDWHSAVHSHWTLARAARLWPQAAFAGDARAALARNLTRESLAAEAAYFRAPGREGFERPYGLAWLLQLSAELGEWNDPAARQQSAWMEPLETIAVERLGAWLAKLPHPIRTGEHGQTAFAMGLALDYAREGNRNTDFADLLSRRTREFYFADIDAPLRFEPSAHDFLSPALAEADLMRRVLSRSNYSAWLDRFMPGIPRDGSAGWLATAASPDPADGKLSHLDGLNLSRAWMLEGLASGLDDTDARRAALLNCARIHADAGLAAISAAHYAGAHWLGSFAVYLLTRRGVDQSFGAVAPSPTIT